MDCASVIKCQAAIRATAEYRRTQSPGNRMGPVRREADSSLLKNASLALFALKKAA